MGRYLRHRRDTRAFTLLELLISLALIGILLVLGLAAFSHSRNATDDTRAKKHITMTQAQIEAIFGTLTPTVYGDSTADLVAKLEAKAPVDGLSYEELLIADPLPTISTTSSSIYVSRDSAVQYTLCSRSRSTRIWCLRSTSAGGLVAAAADGQAARALPVGLPSDNLALSWAYTLKDALCWLPTTGSEAGTCPSELGGVDAGEREAGWKDWAGGTTGSGESSPPPSPSPSPPPSDTTKPVVTITSGPNNQLTGSNEATFSFTASDNVGVSSVQCKIDGGGGFVSCANSKAYTGLADGSHTFTVKATDAAGNYKEATRTWTVDTTKPTITITSAPSGYTSEQNVSVVFTASDLHNVTLKCKLDSGDWTIGCASPYAETGLGDGPHTITISATDDAGNEKLQTISWTVDTVVPSVSITSGPSGATTSSSTTITFTTSETNPVTQTRCRLDAEEWNNACTSPQALTGLGEGSHIFRIEATDAAGNTGFAETTWTVDATAPTVTITSGPSGTVSSTSANIGFTTSDAGSGVAVVRCKLDGGSWESSCTSTKSYSGPLADGSHTVTVEATDAAGNKNTASRSWTVDATAPALSITSGPSGTVTTTSATISFTATDTNLSTVECKLDTGDYASCNASKSYTNLAEGDHTFTVKVTDAANNTQTASRSWKIDSIAPTVTILTGPSGSTTDTSATVTFSASDAGTASLSISCQTDSGDWTLGCTSPYTTLSNLAVGSHTITIRAQDDAGNWTDQSVVWSVIPTVTLSSISTSITGTAVTFSWTSSSAGTTEVRYDTVSRSSWGDYANYANADLIDLKTTHNKTVNYLAPGTYYYRVRTVSGESIGTSSEQTVEVTASATPSAMLNYIGSSAAGKLYYESEVYASAISGTTMYVGGLFQEINRSTGNGLLFDKSNGVTSNGIVNVDGNTQVAISDGAGGYYIGGDFATVGGQTATRLEHILPGGSPDPNFTATVNYTVRTLALSGATLYVGGSFTQIGGQTRNYIGAVSATTGAVTSWNPNANNNVFGLAIDGSTVYVAGSFSSIGGQTRNSLAALSTSTGNATAWNPNANGAAYEVTLSGSTLYAGGEFTTISGVSRSRIASYNTSDGSITSWNPGLAAYPRDILIDGSTAYVAGGFTQVGCASGCNNATTNRSYIAAFSTSTGAVTSWNPGSGNEIVALGISGSTLYAAGQFTTVGCASGCANASTSRRGAAAFSTSTGVVTDWNPGLYNNNSATTAFGKTLVVGSDDVYVAGAFDTVREFRWTRQNIAAIDLTTGEPTSWNPGANASVHSFLVDGSTVWVGGAFGTIGGQTRSGIAALSASTGNATSWRGDLNSSVYALALDGTTIYAGGAFTQAGCASGCGSAATTRNRLASFSTSTGAVTSWNPNLNAGVDALHINSGTLYVVGAFTTVAGGTARGYTAAYDLASGNLGSWNPNANGEVFSITSIGSTIYLGGTFSTVGASSRAKLAAVNTSATVLSWNPNANHIVYTLTTDGTKVYAGGQFNTLGCASGCGSTATTRSLAGTLHATTGAVQNWDLSSLVSTGGVTPYPIVRTIAVGSSTAFVQGLRLRGSGAASPIVQIAK